MSGTQTPVLASAPDDVPSNRSLSGSPRPLRAAGGSQRRPK
eukprot:CAMPEP_0203850174 /NCGR_PEP_ID=MMETSP0359-20131031/6620_1 /ASSEMBLY_ACC=CAM_ASM_000338 /TAXON_ID=268821 /ORGANISM="Scrippsiella Hangoei, Strain SHTV-5" /LENGTH=40 /DNA_ID= /DNA_START= /DNA_END= /DNA_ORIENTATION=